MLGAARTWGFALSLATFGAGLARTSESTPVRYRNTAPGVAYVGSGKCAHCHYDVTRNFRRTPMGASMDLANRAEELARVPEPVTIYNADFDRYFKVFREGPDLYQSEYQKDANGKTIFTTTHKLEYVVGSGLNGYTYVVRRGSHLFEAPLSYYSEPGKWDLSPGYVAADMGFNRPVLAGCLACHNGQPQAVPKREALYRDPPFRFQEVALGCEVCHGPGELHEREARGRRPGMRGSPDTSIVNPARLSGSLADDICMNCHQGGHTRVLQPGKDYLDFRPGTPLNLVSAIFKVPLLKAERDEADRAQLLTPVRGGLEMPGWWKNSSLEMSKCYQAGGGRLRCVTCHSIHNRPAATARAKFYREKCLTCHTDQSCRLPLVQRAQQSNDCAGCHMPKRPVAGIAHSSSTNHRIMRRPGQPLPEIAFEPDRGLPGLIYLNAPKHGDAELSPLTKLAAYGEIMKTKPELERYYLSVLDEVSRSQPDVPLVLAALGRKALFDKDYPRAVQYLARALERGSEATTTFLDLGDALTAAGDLQRSVQVLRRGIEVSPYAQVLYKSLALDYIALKQYSQAHDVMKRYMDLFPEDSFMRGLLEKVEAGQPGQRGN